MSIKKHPRIFRIESRKPMQFRNDDDREFKSLRLVDRHQPNGIRRFIDLALAFTTSDCLKLLNITNKVANQMMTRAFETCGECEQSLHVGESLRTVEVCRNHCSVFRLFDGETQEIVDRIMMPTRDQSTDQVRCAVQKLVFFIRNECNFTVMFER